MDLAELLRLGDAAAGFGDKIPGMWESFIGTIPGSIGETSTLACLIGAAILLYTGIGSWRIMLSVFHWRICDGIHIQYFWVNTLMQIDPITSFVVGWICFRCHIYGN